MIFINVYVYSQASSLIYLLAVACTNQFKSYGNVLRATKNAVISTAF